MKKKQTKTNTANCNYISYCNILENLKILQNNQFLALDKMSRRRKFNFKTFINRS